MLKLKTSKSILLLGTMLTLVFTFVGIILSEEKAYAAQCPAGEYSNETKPPNWGINTGPEDHGFASLTVNAHVAGNSSNTLDVSFKLNSKLPSGSYPKPNGPNGQPINVPDHLWPHARIFSVISSAPGDIRETGRTESRWFGTNGKANDKIHADPHSPFTCPGWEQLGPGNSAQRGNRFVLDCQQKDANNNIREVRFWLSDISAPAGYVWGGHWQVRMSINGSFFRTVTNNFANNPMNPGDTPEGQEKYLTVTNGKNARFNLIWHPTPPPPPVPPPNSRCSMLEVQGGGLYGPNQRPTRTFVRIVDGHGPNHAFTERHVLVQGEDGPYSIIGSEPGASKTWHYKPKDLRIKVDVIRKFKNSSNQWIDYYNNTAYHTCYDASCTLDVSGENVPPTYPANGVQHRSGFNIDARIYNNAGPPEATSLFASLEPNGSQPLVFSQTGGPPLGFWRNPGLIPRNQMATPSFPVTEPGWDAGNYPVHATLFYDLDHNGYGGNDLILATCSTGYDVYKEFNVEPTAGAVNLQYGGNDDSEDPDRAVFSWSARNNLTGTVSNASVSRNITKSPPNPPGTVHSQSSSHNLGTASGNDTTPISNSVLGDEYCGRVTVSPAEGWEGPPGKRVVTVPSRSDGGPDNCDRVVNRPYLKAYGADVVAGSAQIGDDCNPGAGSDVLGYLSSRPNKSGTGSQLAAIALGAIEGFSTASLRTTAPNAINGLSFGNSPAPAGGYAGESICFDDYFNETQSEDEDKKNTISNTTINLNSPLSYHADKDQTLVRNSTNRLSLNGVNNFNDKKIIYVDGDVRINNDISYANFSDPMKAASFTIIARGNIYISHNVKRLDGLYIAQQKSDGSGGVIYTCANGYTPYLPDTNALFNNCGGIQGENSNPADDKRLIVNGAFIAHDVKFYRVHKSLRDSKSHTNETADRSLSSNNTHASEVFNFSPEIYLSPPPFARDTDSSIPIQFYTTLPPIL